MGDIVNLEAYRKRRAAKPAALVNLPKPKQPGSSQGKRPKPAGKPSRSPVDSTAPGKKPPTE